MAIDIVTQPTWKKLETKKKRLKMKKLPGMYVCFSAFSIVVFLGKFLTLNYCEWYHKDSTYYFFQDCIAIIIIPFYMVQRA